MAKGRFRLDFTIPASGGTYATEILYLRNDAHLTRPTGDDEMDDVDEFQVDIEAIPTNATLEMDFLQEGEDPAVEASWTLAVQQYTVVGVQPLEAVVGQAIRVRGKSGGTSGTLTAVVNWRSFD